MLGRRKRWVTKSDVASYYRCPYAWWLLETGQITFAETISEFALGLLQAGNDYQRLVEQAATPIVVSPGSLSGLLQGDITILRTPPFENCKLRLRGIPDGIEAACGGLRPIEIKSHRSVTRLDQLELAFYWLLLAPHRTSEIAPSGVVILRREGRPARVEVPITGELLGEVQKLIIDVRRARKRGVVPRVCGCQVCSRVRRDDVLASVTARKDVTMIWGVGRVYAAALAAVGYTTWDSLAGCDPAQLTAVLTAAGARGVGVATVESWQLHARALAFGRPEFRPGTRAPLDGPYIALDLEYDVTPGRDHIWLTGAAVAHGDGAEPCSWWADTPAQERDALASLQVLLDRHPDLPVVTWAGNSADVPRLIAAANRHSLPALADALTERHIDVYAWLQRTGRLPILSLGLKQISAYLGYRPRTDVTDGLDALRRYQVWMASHDERIREQLLAYNADDIAGLVHTVTRLTELAVAHQASPVTTA